MPIAAIVAGISGAAALGGAAIQSHAAGKAAKTQQQATDKAISVQREANQPYMDLGRQAASRLGQMAPQPYQPVFSGPGGSNGAQAYQPPPASMQGTLGSLGRPPGAMSPGQPPQGVQMAQMQAPDGSVRPVPMTMVDELMRRGAKRVG